MCFTGNQQVDTTVADQLAEEARLARVREEERQARIAAGTDKLDEVFGQFDPEFYNARKGDFLNYYQPQLDDQFHDARKNLTFALARAGTLRSSMAGDHMADLLKQYELQKGSLVSSAEADVASAKTNTANEKSALLAQLNATGDADRVSNEALGRTQQLFAERPTYNPLGDIFAGVANGIGNTIAANENRRVYQSYFGPANAAGSSRTVR